MISEALVLAASGCVFGLAGGFTPGPTTALVVGQALRFGPKEGVKVAIAPLLTDPPIIVLAVLLVGQLARFQAVLGWLTLFGAAFLLFLAVESLRVRGVEIDENTIEPRSIRKGFLVNLLNPHPYLFWIMVGAPALLRAVGIGVLAAGLFLLGLYGGLVGAKVFVGLLVGRSRSILRSRGYVYVNRLLGLALALFAALFARDGLRLLGVGLHQ
jgi:threonine/homoserine/homoserine lactone efflux protein